MIGADRFADYLDNATAKKHATQRYKHGYSEVDMWNFDTFLADVIVAGCQWHIDSSHTTPGHLEPEEWKSILFKIRNGFLLRDSSGGPNPPKRAWKLLRKHYRFMWD